MERARVEDLSDPDSRASSPARIENEMVTDSADDFIRGHNEVTSCGYESVSKLNGVLSELKNDVLTSAQTTPGVESVSQGYESHPIYGLETIYVQQKNGSYKPAPRDKAFSSFTATPDEHPRSFLNSALDIAIFVQKIWFCLSNICFGLLAGMAALHLVIMGCTMTISTDPEENLRTVQLYSDTAFILPLCFYVFLCFCLVSLFDRFDLAHLDGDQVKESFSYRFSWVVVVLYLVILLLHTLSAKYDDYFILYDHDDSFTYEPQYLKAKLEFWRNLDVTKCVLCVLGWCLVSLLPTKDLLLLHLEGLKKYDIPAITNPS